MSSKTAKRKAKKQRRDANPHAAPRFHKASYDASKTSPENQRHWSNADDNPPSVANAPWVRQKLRMRAGYERDNNPYCSGMVSTLATDVIGYTIPKLQVLTADSGFNSYLEGEWQRWSESAMVNLPSKLRVLDEGKRVEGENFLCLVNDEEVGAATGVMLNALGVSSSRVTDSTFGSGRLEESGLYNDDGVMVNPNTGRAVKYKVVSAADELKMGGSMGYGNTVEVPARYMLHWYAPRRPGQYRGVSELTPSLPLFAMLRRYDLATLVAAETAALLAGVMKTTLPAAEPASVTEWTKTELERGTLLTLPDGWDATQFKPEQPIATYGNFVDYILRQIGRALDIPFGVVAGDSSKYNYSSARLDYTGYDERLRYDRQQLCIRILTPLFIEWLIEFAKMDSRVGRMMRGGTIPHTWQFSKRPSIDPQKDAKTSTERISNGTSNLAIECAKDGNSWEDVITQRQNEIQKIKELGLTDGTNVSTMEGLDGTQIQTIMDIVDKGIAKQYPPTTVATLIRLAFPQLDSKTVQSLVSDIKSAVPPAVPAGASVGNAA